MGDQMQVKALNALEQYVLLSKSANSPRAAADLVTQATSALNTFVFAELLQTPNIKSLRATPEYLPYYSLLQIFAWGTWSDYEATPKLPALSTAQAHKLRQLSLLTLATTPENLSYHHLLVALSLPDARALENLVISSIYAGLLNAKLDTISQRVDVSSVTPLRDLKPGGVPRMVHILEDWESRCVDVLTELEEQVRDVRRKAITQRKREDANEKAVAKAMDEKGKIVGKRGFGDEGDEMELDDGIGGRTRNAKKGSGKLMGFGRRGN